MSENEDRYHDTTLDLEAKLKKNVDLLKLGNSLQGMFMLVPKPLSVYDSQLKHGLGYPNPYTLKQAISQCPKLYLASSLSNLDIPLNVRDTEDTLDDASKIQQKMKEKMNDQIMEKLDNENVSLEFQVQSLIKERDNVKLEYQKLFDSIKKTRSQSQKEMDELIEHVSEKTYAYGAIRAENQNLLSTISELKTRLETVEKGMNAASSVRRPMNRDSHVNNSVLANSKNLAKNIAVYVRKNKQTNNTSANVISNKENVNDVNVANAAKAKTLLCVSCMQNVLIPCHDNCLAKYKLNVHSNVRRDLSTNSRTPRSSNTTNVVLKTRFSEKLTQSKSLDTTSVVSKPKIDVGSASKAKHKVSSASKTNKRNLKDNFSNIYMKNKIRTSRIWQKWFESQPNVVWSPVNTTPNVHNSRSYEKSSGSVKKWVVKLPTCPCVGSSCVAGSPDRSVDCLGHNLFSVGQFCDGDLEVAFCSKTFCVRILEGDDLITGWTSKLFVLLSISDMAASSPVCLILNLVDGLLKFKYGKDLLCSACERGKSKKASHPPKLVLSDHSKLELLHMDLCDPMRVASINGKKYILVIVDDFSRYTWVYFLHSKDETLEIINKFIDQAQLNYKAKFCKIRMTMQTQLELLPSKEDLDNLFSPMFEEYFEKRYFDSPINSAAQPIKFHKDSPSTSSIIIDKHEAPPIETTSDEQTSLISLTDADEFNQEDSADFNGNLDFVPYNASSHEEIESYMAALEPSNV
ncbi:integrase, catalytic region, zinc finger, CCHC-type containing protein [Tanacetum coccineum]